MEKQFNIVMEQERCLNPKMNKIELCKTVTKRIGYKTSQAQEILQKGINKQLQECRSYSNRCGLKLEEIRGRFSSYQSKLDNLEECNIYHYKRSEFEV